MFVFFFKSVHFGYFLHTTPPHPPPHSPGRLLAAIGVHAQSRASASRLGDERGFFFSFFLLLTLQVIDGVPPRSAEQLLREAGSGPPRGGCSLGKSVTSA